MWQDPGGDQVRAVHAGPHQGRGQVPRQGCRHHRELRENVQKMGFVFSKIAELHLLNPLKTD